MWAHIAAFAWLAAIFLAHDIRCFLLGRWSLFSYNAVLGRPKVIAQGRAGKAAMRVIRIPKGAVLPDPNYFRKGGA